MGRVAVIIGWSATIFSLVTIPFHILFLCMLIKYRNTTDFNHAFYKILMSLSVADILQLMVSEFVNQFLTFHGWVADFCLNVLGDFGAHVITIIFWGTAMAQVLTVVSVAINRFTAYVYPLQFETVRWGIDLGSVVVKQIT
uniref:G-protein coupled receptors family 1 profile domain-containing protein n=1 Tax=Plectus sambesii TaxID=2011161 RepID=A0A914X4R8_9BILA